MRRALLLPFVALLCAQTFALAQVGVPVRPLISSNNNERHLLCTGRQSQPGVDPNPRSWEEIVTIDPVSSWVSWQALKLRMTVTPTNYIATEHQAIGATLALITVDIDRQSGKFAARSISVETGKDFWWIQASCVPSAAPVTKF